jgi:hypothetical protein
MAENDETQEPKWIPPYIAWRTILNLVERLETNMPPQIDKSFLKGSNQSNAQTMKALKALELIEEDGTVTPSLIRLVEAGAERPAAVRALIEKFYPEPVGLASINATQAQLDKAFEDYGVSGSTLRKAVSFYLKAAAYARVPLSPNFKTPTKTAPTARRRRARSAPANGQGTNAGNGAAAEKAPAGPPDLETLKTRYIEMLMGRVDEADDLDTALLDRIEGLLGLGGPENTSSQRPVP